MWIPGVAHSSDPVTDLLARASPAILPVRVRAATTLADAAVVLIRVAAILVLLSPLLLVAILFA